MQKHPRSNKKNKTQRLTLTLWTNLVLVRTSFLLTLPFASCSCLILACQFFPYKNNRGRLRHCCPEGRISSACSAKRCLLNWDTKARCKNILLSFGSVASWFLALISCCFRICEPVSWRKLTSRSALENPDGRSGPGCHCLTRNVTSTKTKRTETSQASQVNWP